MDRTSADGVLVANPQAANLMLISKSLDEIEQQARDDVTRFEQRYGTVTVD